MWRGMQVSFRDVLFLLVFAYLVIAAVALAHVAKQDQDSSQHGQTPPGTIVIEMRWAPNLDDDVDLWVQAPGDVPVGYSNKSGVIFNLVRDDLGKSGDPNSMNEEMAFGRGHWPGEYVVNNMLFRNRDGILPVPVTTTVSLRDKNGDTREVLKSSIDLTFEGQESTVFRFTLNKDGAIAPGSVNRIHKNLRSPDVKNMPPGFGRSPQNDAPSLPTPGQGEGPRPMSYIVR